jgi:hypothetical protein
MLSVHVTHDSPGRDRESFLRDRKAVCCQISQCSRGGSPVKLWRLSRVVYYSDRVDLDQVVRG